MFSPSQQFWLTDPSDLSGILWISGSHTILPVHACLKISALGGRPYNSMTRNYDGLEDWWLN